MIPTAALRHVRCSPPIPMTARRSCLALLSLMLARPVYAADQSPPKAPRAPRAGGLPTVSATETAERGRWATAAATGGLYVGLATYLTLAWWSESQPAAWHLQKEGWFGKGSYAGGADKLGHGWTNYALVRGVSRMLTYGGWDERGSLMTAAGLSLGFWTASEIKDGYYGNYGFSYEDMIFNTAGAALGVAFELWPEIDRRFDLRVAYLPSSAFVDALADNGPLNVPEDYTGQTYLLCYHLGSIEPLMANPWLSWGKFLDVSAGFQAVNYKPIPVNPDAVQREQSLFLGLSLNLQPLLDGATSGGGRFLRFGTEMLQIPFTTLRVAGVDRSPDPEPMPAP